MAPIRLTATYERDRRGMWIVELAEDRGVHSYGRTLAAARTEMLQAASAWAQVNPDDLDLVDNIVLPPAAHVAIADARARRQAADVARDDALNATRNVARYLKTEIGLTVRDAADLLAVSPSRISQLLAEEER